MTWLQIVGMAFQGAGLLAAVYGLRIRYREFKPEGPGAFDPAIQASRRTAGQLGRWTRARVRSILRRPPTVEAHAGTAHATVRASINARGRVGFGPLPTGRSNKPALDELDRRVRDLLERVSDVRGALTDETARIDGDVEAVRADLRVEVERLANKVQRLATGDVGLQYVGFTMIGVGLILQAIGATIGG